MPPKQFPPGSRKRPHSAVGGVMFDSTNVRDASAGSSKRSSVTAVAHPKAASASLDSPLTIRQRVKLNQQQQDVLELVNAGKNVFLTGSAGTGKSVVLRELIKSMQQRRGADAVAVTASTGIAACNIGGVTVHSFAGFGIGAGTAEHCLQMVRRNKDSVDRWKRTRLLVIDEVSMLSAAIFDKLVYVARELNKTRKKLPLTSGGIQLVVAGDFFQLPPVYNKAIHQGPIFAFDASTWSEVIDHSVTLRQVFRQRDNSFASHLNEIRIGSLSEACVQFFKSLQRPLDASDGITPAQLYPLRSEVDNANQLHLSRLKGKSTVFEADDGGKQLNALDALLAPKTLELKVGCQVMLVKNTSDTLVNGSMGKVVAFGSDETQTHDAVAGNQSCTDARRYPVVDFLVQDRIRNTTTIERLLVTPQKFNIQGDRGSVIAHRTQVPLMLAWALSIHKSQGQSIARVRVDLSQAFETGQAYVALSRATTAEGLQVVNFNRKKVMTHDRVVEWTKEILQPHSALCEPEPDEWPFEDGEINSDDWDAFESDCRAKVDLSSTATGTRTPALTDATSSSAQARSEPPKASIKYFSGTKFFIHTSVRDSRAVRDTIRAAGGTVVADSKQAHTILCQELSSVQLSVLLDRGTSGSSTKRLPPAIVHPQYVTACHAAGRKLSSVRWASAHSIASAFGKTVSSPRVTPFQPPW